RDQPVEEVPHPSAAEGDPGADRHPLAHLEAGDRLARAAHLRALACNRRELVDCGIECLRVGLRLADAHVERDLLDARHLHDRAQAELVLEAQAQLLLVQALQPRGVSVAVGRHYLSMSCPQSARLQTRTFLGPSPLLSLVSIPPPVGRSQTGHTSITRETGSGAAFSTIPPGSIC